MLGWSSQVNCEKKKESTLPDIVLYIKWGIIIMQLFISQILYAKTSSIPMGSIDLDKSSVFAPKLMVFL